MNPSWKKSLDKNVILELAFLEAKKNKHKEKLAQEQPKVVFKEEFVKGSARKFVPNIGVPSASNDLPWNKEKPAPVPNSQSQIPSNSSNTVAKISLLHAKGKTVIRSVDPDIKLNEFRSLIRSQTGETINFEFDFEYPTGQRVVNLQEDLLPLSRCLLPDNSVKIVEKLKETPKESSISSTATDLRKSKIYDSNKEQLAIVRIKPSEIKTVKQLRDFMENLNLLQNFKPYDFCDIDGDQIHNGQEADVPFNEVCNSDSVTVQKHA